MKNFWNATQYSQFLDARTRPARDLLESIPSDFLPNTVVDLGCGPGNSTILLKNRWSNAEIIGIDTSVDMLQKARNDYPDILFEQGDINHYMPDKQIDCLFANASMQWCDHHPELIKRLSSFLNPNGFLAIQMPNNFHMPAHQSAIEVLNKNNEWRSLLKNLRYGVLTNPLYNPMSYYDIFSDANLKQIQVWQTEYFVEMNSHLDIFNWGKGTGLQPILSVMDEANQKKFQDAFVECISRKFPIQSNHKVLLPFMRVFMVGMK